MNLFRDALNLWARRDSQTASHNPGPELESEFEMPRRNGASAPTTPANSNSNMLSTSNSNPNTHSPLSSSPLSPADSTTSFTTAAAVSPDHIPAGGAAFVRSGRGEAGGEGDEDTRDGDGGDGGDLPSADVAFSDMASQYHKAKSLPPELKEHCRVYLEEALPRQAIFLLDGLLSTRSEDPRQPAYCPPPSQVSLLCSIIIHPDYTTRPKEPDWPQISLQALVYLRDLLAVIGPVNAGFKEAVLFGTNAAADIDLDYHLTHDGSLDADERGLVRLSPRHGNDSIWQRGRDFFSVVGWAFNCSFLYPERWQWWSRWLEFMLDLLETDLEERNRLDVENGSDDMPLLRSSILASYIAQRSGRTTDVAMWIMKALFADGSTSSTSVFQEVWHREHKNKSLRAANKRKREKVNIDKGEYGGYLDDESVHSSQASEPPTPQKKGMRPSLGEEILETAYVETIPLRQRLFSLVSYLCYGLPDTPPIDFSNLYQKFEQRVKELPLTVFSSFINISTSALRTDQQVEMLQGVLFLFMPAGALSPRKVDRARFEEGGISPIILERCFLPYPANTIEVEDHAKMSLLLENLVMVVWRHGERDERFSRGLGEAVRKGIEARWEKINKKKTRGRARVASEGDLGARTVLKASDLRLGWLVEAIEESVATAEDAMDEDDGL